METPPLSTNPETPLTPPSPQPPIPPTPPTSKSPTVLIFTLLILAVAAASFLLGKYSLQNKTPAPAVEVTPRPTLFSTPTPDLTEGWKTYTNTKYKYSFKYPDDYFKFQQEFDASIYLAPSAGEGGNGPKFLKPGDVWLDIEAATHINSSSIDEYLNSNELYSNAQKKSTTIGGLNGYKITYDFAAVAGNVRVYNYEGLILKNKIFYIITLSSWEQNTIQKYEQTFDLILSFFKFLD